MESLASKPVPGASVTGKGESDGKKPSRAPSRKAIAKTSRSFWKTVLRWLAGIVAICVLPLPAIVRLSAWLSSAYGIWPWISVLGGAIATALVVFLVALVLLRKASGGFRWLFKRVMSAVALVYCGYLALLISAGNMGSEAAQETYASLHPSLRLALSTWIPADPSLVIGDAERSPEDLGRMGLPEDEAALHAVTSSGYVHAVDLRTAGRPEWRNFLTTLYFKATGFRVARHTGTTDHLHVSLE